MTAPSSVFDQIEDHSRPPVIVAELSANHSGDLSRALEIIDACAEAGADALKLQTYTADTITLDHDGPGFVLEGGLWRPGQVPIGVAWHPLID